MDANKRQVLRELPYRVQRVCGLCKYARFGVGDWGTCGRVTYDHLKHTDAERQLSINRYGSCDDFDPDIAAVDGLGAFCEFLNG